MLDSLNPYFNEVYDVEIQIMNIIIKFNSYEIELV